MKTKKLLSLLIVLAMIAATVLVMPMSAFASAQKIGNSDVTWELVDNETGKTLILSGTGDMPDFEKNTDNPWYSNRYDITALKVTSGVTKFGKNSFSHCSKIKTVRIDSVESWCNIDMTAVYAYPGCYTDMDALYVNDVLTTDVVIPSSITSIGNEQFNNFGMLKSVTFPSNLESIGQGAFNYCKGLKQIVIPSGVTQIGNYAFNDCSNLRRLEVQADTPPTLGGDRALSTKSSVLKLYVPEGKVDAYKAASNWGDVVPKIVEIGNFTVTTEVIGRGDVTATPDFGKEGTPVTLTAVAEDGYEFKRFESNEVQIATEGTTGTFTMPAADPTVTAVFEGIFYPITINVNDSNFGTVTANVDEAIVGEKVELTIEPEEGYGIVGFESEDDIYVYIDDTESPIKGCFEMPSKPVVLTAVFNKIYPITVSANDDSMGEVYISTSSAPKGKEIEIGAYANDGYQFVRFESDDVEIQCDNYAYSGYGTFYMADKPVSIKAVFAEPCIATPAEAPDGVKMINGAQAIISKNGLSARMRMFWNVDRKPESLQVYFCNFDVFEEGSMDDCAKTQIIIPDETLKNGGIFFATLTDIVDFDETYIGIPIINGIFHLDAIISGTVNNANLNK